MTPLMIYPTHGTWWRASVADSDEGVVVELWKRPDVTANVWALSERTLIEDAPFHLVCSHVADMLDGLPVNAGRIPL